MDTTAQQHAHARTVPPVTMLTGHAPALLAMKVLIVEKVGMLQDLKYKSSS